MRYLGVIEGFYGRSWPWSARAQYPQFMAGVGLNSYIYAPKSDSKLRSNWREPWTEQELAPLIKLATECKRCDIGFGVGLSPLGLTAAALESNGLSMLDARLEQIAVIGCDFLAILFDDVASDGNAMAQRQLAIVEHVSGSGCATNYLVCPTYYCTDPVLEKLFGLRPKNYWRELGAGLDSRIDYFWTGEQVCSRHYSEDNLQYISEQFRRAPVLWDNYPVNDGEKLSRYLHLKPFNQQADAGVLAALTAGHFANPMNQACLSQLSLSTLADQYMPHGTDIRHKRGAEANSAEYAWRAFAEQKLGRQLAKDLIADVELFQSQGLDTLDDVRKAALREKYGQYTSGFACELATEIVDWLDEKYRFDPACLTG